jgi:DNA-binding response OmpR family regulator
MITQLRLKILAFGSHLMIHRLKARVDHDEVSITGCTEASEAFSFLKQDEFDIIIVDNLMKEAQSVCRNAVGLAKAPVTLILQEKAADWQKLRGVVVDGYLPDEAGSVELMARIKAYSRRKPEFQEIIAPDSRLPLN